MSLKHAYLDLHLQKNLHSFARSTQLLSEASLYHHLLGLSVPYIFFDKLGLPTQLLMLLCF